MNKSHYNQNSCAARASELNIATLCKNRDEYAVGLIIYPDTTPLSIPE